MTEETKSFTKNDKLLENETMAFFSKRVVVSDEEDEYRSYESGNIRLSVKKDGSLCLSNQNGEGFIYFCKDQLVHLQKALEFALKQQNLTEKVSKQSARCALPCTCPKNPLGFVMAIAHDCPEHGMTSQ